MLILSTEEQALIKSYSLGCHSYVSKLVDFIQQFVDAVRRLGLNWLVPNKVPPV